MKKIAQVVMVLVMSLVGSASVLASTTTIDADKANRQLVLLQEINRLLLEVKNLQALLKERSTSIPKEPYQVVFFDRTYEAIYFVNGIKLQAIKSSDLIRPVDNQLFELLIGTLGKEVVSQKVREWRVFYDDEEDLGGFVELVAGTEGWVFGVNRAQYEINDFNSRRAFADLYIHEYAHILIYDEPQFVQNYTKQFWTAADKSHQSDVEAMGQEKRFLALTKYFEANSGRFVSDYATLSPEEDLAETFVAFVRENRGKENTVRAEKINTFYNVPESVLARSLIRNNLEKLGVLN